MAIKTYTNLASSDLRARRAYCELRLLRLFSQQETPCDQVPSLLDVFTPDKHFEHVHELSLVMDMMGAMLHDVIRDNELVDQHVRCHWHSIEYFHC